MTQSNAFTGGTTSVAPTTQIPREQRAKLPAGQGVWPAILVMFAKKTLVFIQRWQAGRLPHGALPTKSTGR